MRDDFKFLDFAAAARHHLIQGLGLEPTPGPETCVSDFQRANWSRKLRIFRDRLGCLSFLSGLASIWPIRSRVGRIYWM